MYLSLKINLIICIFLFTYNNILLFLIHISKVYTNTLFIYHKTPSVCFANCWWHHEVYFYKSPWSLFLNWTTIGKVLYIMSSGGLYETGRRKCEYFWLQQYKYPSIFNIIRLVDRSMGQTTLQPTGLSTTHLMIIVFLFFHNFLQNSL